MLRAMRRGLETGLRRLLHGHEGGNSGYGQEAAYGLPRQFPTLPRVSGGTRSPPTASIRQLSADPTSAEFSNWTPLTFVRGHAVPRAELNNVRWVSHCRDLVQL